MAYNPFLDGVPTAAIVALAPDGDEVLYLISGRIRVVFLDDPIEDIEVLPGAGLVVPKGLWHRVDILEPSQIVYLTPGPNNRFRPLDETG